MSTSVWSCLAVLLGALSACTLSACAKHEAKELVAPSGQPVRIDGSSTVYLVSKAVSEELRSRGVVSATVGESGTTGGFRKFCAGEIDVADASRPIERSEIDACLKAGIDFIELPIGYDGLAVVVNASSKWVDHLTVSELKTIWAPEATGSLTNWKQIRDSFPDRPLHLFGPGRDSGTFDYFTQAIVGKQRASRSDYAGSEDDMVLVKGVQEDENALGYFGLAYVSRKPGLAAVAIDDGIVGNGDGPIAPSKTTVANGTYQPLSRPLFIYVSAKALQRSEVEKFVSFYMFVTHELSAEIGYVSLPEQTSELVRRRFEARTTGTMFPAGPPPIGVNLDRLLGPGQ